MYASKLKVKCRITLSVMKKIRVDEARGTVGYIPDNPLPAIPLHSLRRV